MNPPHPRAVPGDRGFTLVELLIATTVLLLVFAGVATALVQGMGVARSSRSRIVAANLASSAMEETRATAFERLQPGYRDETTGEMPWRERNPSVGPQQYKVERAISWIDDAGEVTVCGSDVPKPGRSLQVRISVSWGGLTALRPVVTETVIAPPGGQYAADGGHLLVSVRTAAGGIPPEPGHRVTVTGPGGTKWLYTGREGCVFFYGLAPGAWKAELNTPGHVDETHRQVAVRTADIVPHRTEELRTILYDRASAVRASVRGAQGGAVSASGRSVTVLRPGNGGTGSTVLDASAGAGRPLFPALGGYEAFAGSCAAADPGAGARARFATAPGAAVMVDVPLATVIVRVRDTAGRPVAADLYASGCGGTDGLGRSAGDGDLTVALPRGTWTFSAGGWDPASGGWPRRALELRQPQAYEVLLEVKAPPPLPPPAPRPGGAGGGGGGGGSGSTQPPGGSNPPPAPQPKPRPRLISTIPMPWWS